MERSVVAVLAVPRAIGRKGFLGARLGRAEHPRPGRFDRSTPVPQEHPIPGSVAMIQRQACGHELKRLPAAPKT
jgi:hypothetical protein